MLFAGLLHMNVFVMSCCLDAGARVVFVFRRAFFVRMKMDLFRNSKSFAEFSRKLITYLDSKPVHTVRTPSRRRSFRISVPFSCSLIITNVQVLGESVKE
jgi:hypothetical protein